MPARPIARVHCCPRLSGVGGGGSRSRDHHVSSRRNSQVGRHHQHHALRRPPGAGRGQCPGSRKPDRTGRNLCRRRARHATGAPVLRGQPGAEDLDLRDHAVAAPGPQGNHHRGPAVPRSHDDARAPAQSQPLSPRSCGLSRGPARPGPGARLSVAVRRRDDGDDAGAVRVARLLGGDDAAGQVLLLQRDGHRQRAGADERAAHRAWEARSR